MKSIGGYFGLEMASRGSYHPGALALNSGRNAFRLLLRNVRPERVLVPLYLCDGMLAPLRKEGIRTEFYRIDEQLTPILPKDMYSSQTLVLCVNYFGLKDEMVEKLAGECKNLAVDNAQAFFSRPLDGVHTVYSPRKFFGVPDGGYLYTGRRLDGKLKRDTSSNRFKHLLARRDLGAEAGFPAFQKNESLISNLPVRLMSNLTERILGSIDYEQVRIARKMNFDVLDRHLSSSNLLTLPMNDSSVPMAYPFMTKKRGLRKHLIRHKIYVATYWGEVLERTGKKTFEQELVKRLIALPVDQRYEETDMIAIVEKIINFR